MKSGFIVLRAGALLRREDTVYETRLILYLHKARLRAERRKETKCIRS